jgi:hypothetical protein
MMLRLSKTRSGKILHGTIKKIADHEPWTIPAIIDDPAILDEIGVALGTTVPPRRKEQGRRSFGYVSCLTIESVRAGVRDNVTASSPGLTRLSVSGEQCVSISEMAGTSPAMTEPTMPLFICAACGTQYPQSASAPAQCVICEEERQYVPPRGQTWTTLDALRVGHTNSFREYENGVIGIGTQPQFAIGQRALLVRTPGGNVLWDCISLLDSATVTMIKAIGGIRAIAISHPHFYTTMVEWARAFHCPIHLHAADKQWVVRPDPAIKHWDGETLPLWDGVTLVRCGGHFEGGMVLHWAGGADGRGLICSGDILTVCTDRKWLTFMRSYPNFIPLPARVVNGIGKALAPFSFDIIYGHYFDRVIAKDGKQVLEKSIARYITSIEGKRGY